LHSPALDTSVPLQRQDKRLADFTESDAFRLIP
jgi:hypothetical protein